MITLFYAGYFKIALLFEQLLAAIPQLVDVSGSVPVCLATVCAMPPSAQYPLGGVSITLPVTISEAAVEAVVLAHSATGSSVIDLRNNDRKARLLAIDTDISDLVGRSFDTLLAADKLRLLMALLLRLGVINASRIVQPQNQWDSY